jgi:type III secretory pathway component EscS
MNSLRFHVTFVVMKLVLVLTSSWGAEIMLD